MNARPFPRINVNEITLDSIALLIFSAIPNASATVSATGTVTQTASGATNTYTLSLQNTSNAGESLETLWFGWTPGKDYLDSSPVTVQTPTGWTDTITHGGSTDGYAIKFTTAIVADAIQAGNSLSGFGFTSTDTLAQLQGNSNFYNTIPATTSEVSTLSAFGGTPSVAFSLPVNTVPEPTSMMLISSGVAALALFRGRTRDAGARVKMN